jgi:hypothetical protein
MLRTILIIMVVLLVRSSGATEPAPAPPADETIDWLLEQSQPIMPEQPTELPAADSPFDRKPLEEAQEGIIRLSSGERFRGSISTTAEKPLRVWDEGDKEYRDIPFALVRRIEAEVVWERDEPDWRFIESGSDLKEFTGRTYPAREYRHTLTLLNGQTVIGGVAAPLFLRTPDGRRTFILHKRHKGELDQPLEQLHYVSRVILGEFPDDSPDEPPAAAEGGP